MVIDQGATARNARVVLVMPVRNEASDLPATLASLATQRFDHGRMLLLIIDGDSDDDTAAIAQRWFKQHDIAGRVIRNPARTIPTSLNTGIAHADDADIIVRLDGHTMYGENYLADLILALEAAPGDVACVGGPQHPVSDDEFEHRLVATLYSNPMGLGGADHRSGRGMKYVTQVYLGAWRPGVLQTVGGFDTRWEANEDSELSARLLARGWKILWMPLDCRYKINRSVIKTVAQWGAYGFWRAQTLQRYRWLAKPRHFAAPVAMFLAIIIALTPLRLLDVLGFVAYVFAVIILRNSRDSIPLALASCIFFPSCQIAWSIGLLRGLVIHPQPFSYTPLALSLESSAGSSRPDQKEVDHLDT